MTRCSPVVLLVALLTSGVTPPAVAAKAGKKNEAAESEDTSRLSGASFGGMTFRGVGPALMSGRIADIDIDPTDPSRWVVGVASGGVWITANAGTTWSPVFDDQPSYSIGCVAIDPNDPMTIWIGTGENNSQRSVAYGDGVYKSIDGGSSWSQVGLEHSEHIGQIVIDPRDSRTVFVAAQGPLWSAGGDRGLYKTSDGGETWKLVLEIDEHTGVNEIVYDPRNPDRMIASSYQRRRRTWTLINGGPGSGIWRSNDAGETWTEVTSGLPTVEMGRIGLTVSPADPDVVYAIVEAQDEAGGIFRSENFGVSWEKRSDYMSGSPQYYNELVADPKDVSRVYSMDTWLQVTDDGGANWRKVGEMAKHVDNHDLWIDSDDTRHMIAACDGGIYETFDRGATWDYFDNLPVTQFYKVSVDNDEPFYNIYGGTQDNASQGGPSRTPSLNGISNRDWFVTVMGDGFKTQVDPSDADVVYSQWQYGGLVRYDRGSGEVVDIQPQPAEGEPASRWNWSAPLVISPHDTNRLYYASQRVYRSDDRGDSWTPISPDLTRQIDRNQLEVMDRIWGVDTVAKNASTSFYGNIVSLDESPRVPGLIYVGTDDGLIQVSEDNGANWRKIESFTGVPQNSYVTSVTAALDDDDSVYATFDNHKAGDFAPYVLESDNRGRSWTSIASGLPERGHVHMLVQDHADFDLLFVGTEFGVFFSPDEGDNWVQLKGGVPTIAVRDLAIQRREDDLILGTFGRSFYVLDDYAPLRGLSEEKLESGAMLFPLRDARAYIETMPLGLPGRSMQGDGFYMAPNPPFGAVFTYWLPETIRNRKDTRRELESDKGDAGERLDYPSWDELRAEDRELPPAIVLTVHDEDGNVVRRISGPTEGGFQRLAWDLRYPASSPTRITPWPTDNPFSSEPVGPLAAPGSYSVSMATRIDGVETAVGQAQTFEVVSLHLGSLPEADRAATLDFQRKTARLQRAVLGSQRVVGEASERLKFILAALDDTPAAETTLVAEALALRERLAGIQVELSGDRTISRRNEPTPPSLVGRVQRIVEGSWTSTSAPTATHRANYRIAAERFSTLLPELTRLLERDLADLESEMEDAESPWTPGRIPRWSPEE